jgi:ribosomal-protein-alanine N-acetyltransferase
MSVVRLDRIQINRQIDTPGLRLIACTAAFAEALRNRSLSPVELEVMLGARFPQWRHRRSPAETSGMSSWVPVVDLPRETAAQLLADPSSEGIGPWFMIERRSNEMIGVIGFKAQKKPDALELMAMIDPTAQGKGFGTEATRRLIAWAFERPNIERVVADCLDTNVPSIRMMSKAGMQQVGDHPAPLGTMLDWEISKETWIRANAREGLSRR